MLFEQAEFADVDPTEAAEARIRDLKAKVGVDFLLDAHTVSAEDASGGGKKLNVAFYTATFGADGRMLGSQSQKVDQTFDAATYAKLLQQGMLLHMDVTPPTGSVQVRLAVQDNRTGFVGTIVAPLAH